LEIEIFEIKGKDLIIDNLTIEKMAYKGFGLGFYNSKPVFVKQAVTGDVVQVKTTFKKKGVFFAEIENILQSSAARRTADCEVFGKCGGCDWLHISYPEQLVSKQQIIEEIFRKFQVENIEPIQASQNEFGYRNKVFMPVQKNDGEELQIGIFAKNTHKVIAHKNCKLQPPVFDEIAQEFLKYVIASKAKIYDEKKYSGNIRHLGIRYSQQNNEILVIVVTKNSKLPFTNQLTRILTNKFPNIVGIVQNVNKDKVNKILGEKSKILYGRSYLKEKLGKLKYQVDYRSFFQVNIGVSNQLLQFVKKYINEQDVVLDTYCGVGSIGLFLADKAKWVIGIENNENAIKDAKKNAEINNIQNVDFIHLDTNLLAEKQLSEHDITTIIFDPPRKGLNRTDIEMAKKYSKIIYISCNPTTQQRDVQYFVKHGFKLSKLKCFDMFPQTYHIENVVVLEK
jgi:23S rRNA (uracil1939-C5)-methyltransferase